MSLMPELVTLAYRLLAGKVVSKAEASKIADLLGSRQEFVAHLVLREEVLRVVPRDSPGARRRIQVGLYGDAAVPRASWRGQST